jgi:hypothetical protein
MNALIHNDPGDETTAALAARAESLSGRLLEVTRTVYRVDEGSEPEAVGFAVFVAIGSIRFAMSAAHVLNERSVPNLHVPVGEKRIPLRGEVTRICSSSSPTLADDDVDVGVVRLSEKLWDSVGDSHFTQWLELDHEGHFFKLNAFALLGSPLAKEQTRACRLIGMETGRGLTEFQGYDPNVHLLISFGKRRSWGSEVQLIAPDSFTISGSGIWNFRKRSLMDAWRPPWLSAIAIKWRHEGRYPYLLGTRIGFVVNALAQRDEDVRATILELARIRPNTA